MREPLLPLLKTYFNFIMTGGTPFIIPKEAIDKLDCKSYRPISVLNIDYKLYASILTKRLEKVMSLLIDDDQTGFIKNRQTHDQHIVHMLIWTMYTVYLSPTAMIKINGSLSNRIALEQGCKHGCPMIPSVFNLFIEPLAQIMQTNPDIHRWLYLKVKVIKEFLVNHTMPPP